MPTLYLIRHGKPERTGVLLGQFDAPLAQQDIPQIRIDVACVYTSELRRAKESAAALFTPTIPRVALAELNEISYGDWDGKTWSEIEAKYPESARAKLANWTRVTPPLGEPWDQFVHRTTHALSIIRRGSFPAAVVAHEAVNAVLANLLTGEETFQFRQAYWQVNEYECLTG